MITQTRESVTRTQPTFAGEVTLTSVRHNRDERIMLVMFSIDGREFGHHFRGSCLRVYAKFQAKAIDVCGCLVRCRRVEQTSGRKAAEIWLDIVEAAIRKSNGEDAR